MESHLVCTSHSPILYVRPHKPDYEDEVFGKLAERRAAIEEFDPEVIFVFGPDHYAGFHLRNMPTFCIGRGEATAVDDVGGFPGSLDVDSETGLGLINFLREEGFDPAQSLKMTVDHGFSQTMKNVMGELDAFPCVPIFIGGMAAPFLTFKRSRQFGEAIGKFAKSLNKRVLFMASGGLSHHPTKYYPLLGEGTPEVQAWQMEGSDGGSFTKDEWFQQLLDLHIEGGQMLYAGTRTKKDIRLNPEIDQKFLDVIVTGDLSPLDGWEIEGLFESAGLGFTELHTWVAAISANMSCGGNPPVIDFYIDTLEYAIGYGIIHAN